MGRGKIPSDATIEQIKATFAETGSYDAAAQSAGVSWSTAKKYADSRDKFEALREQKRPEIIEKAKQVQIALLEAMIDPDSLKKASLQEKSVAFGVVTDKIQLMTGQATSRSEHVSDPVSRLTPEEMEMAARIREKAAASVDS